MATVPFPAEDGNFSPRHRVQTDSAAHAASYSLCMGVYFPGDKVWQGVKLTIYIHLMTRLRMRGDTPLLPQYGA